LKIKPNSGRFETNVSGVGFPNVSGNLLQNTMMGIDDGEQKNIIIILLNIAPLQRVKSVDSLFGIHLIIDL
jgi:hypothetical protein